MSFSRCFVLIIPDALGCSVDGLSAQELQEHYAERTANVINPIL